MDYRKENRIEKSIEPFIKDSTYDAERLYDELFELREQAQYMRGRVASNDQPRYNSYIKVFGRDLSKWMVSVMDLLEVLIYDLKQRQEKELK